MPVDAFLADCALRNLSDATIDQKRRCLTRLESRWGPDLLDLDADQIRVHLARPTLGADARATELSHLRSFYRWCVLNDLLEVDPTAKIPRPRTKRRLPRPISEQDLEVALATAPERVAPMLWLAAFAGLRAKEIAGLRGEDVDWEHDPPVLVIREQKGGDMGAVPLCPVLVGVVSGLPVSGWWFPRRDGRPGHLPAHMVSRLCNDFLHSMGIGHTLHTLRHRFGTQVYRSSGRDLRLTQELLRHRTPVSTAIYTAVDPVEASRAVDGLPVP